MLKMPYSVKSMKRKLNKIMKHTYKTYFFFFFFETPESNDHHSTWTFLRLKTYTS